MELPQPPIVYDNESRDTVTDKELWGNFNTIAPLTDIIIYELDHIQEFLKSLG